VQPARTKIIIIIIPLIIGSYLIHSPSDVAYIQVMRSNNNKRSRTSIFHQQNLPLYSRSQSTLKSNINMLPEKLNPKN
jgi:hypothetical protein